MNFRNVAAFLTGYAAGYSLVIAGVRFAGLFAVNHFLGLGIPIGFLVLGVYAAHICSHSWQSGVAQGVARHKQRSMKKMVEERAKSESATPYHELDPAAKRRMN